MVELLAAIGLGAKELFAYNRESYKFDQDQRLEREVLRLEMQVKRFELFREDVRDLVELTVGRPAPRFTRRCHHLQKDRRS
ncbi:unnamed protein product [Effrenium voratum]|nr:unnamed protein product [Effrenium voratum]